MQGYEDKERARWERTRWMAWQLSIPHYKKGQAPRTAKAFWTFPWEKTDEEELAERARANAGTTAEEAEGLNKLFGKIRRQDEQTG